MSDIQPLQEIETSSFRGDEALDVESIRAIQKTLGLLTSLSPGSNTSFSPSSFSLLSSESKPNEQILSFLRTLLLSTTQSALSNSTSSFLAGPSSESDEYGDVAFCLASSSSKFFGKGSEKEILTLLGLDNLLAKSSSSIKPFPPPKPENGALESLAKLSDVHSFRVEGATDVGTVLFFLVGRYESDWLGIIGVGVWSDS
jgi:hypothetical protein